jgi:subtilisin family serine protease
MKKLILLLASIIMCVKVNAQSTAINLKSITHNGVTDTVDLGPIIVDNTNKVVVSGNKKINYTQYDASTQQQISNGIMTWTATFNLSTQKCWVTAATSDASGNIYLTGGIATGTTNGVDLWVAKYSGTGSQIWYNTFNGNNSTTDFGIAIILDATNNVYVTGSTDASLAASDIVTIKYDGSTGSQVWETTFDYNGYIDFSTSMSFAGTGLYVSGASAASYADWDIVTVEYNPANGAQINYTLTTNPGGNQDKAYSMATDTLGNIYVAGTSWNSNNGSYDISIQKLDTALNMQWIQFYDGGYNLDDAGINVALDDSLHIYVVGTGYYQDTTLSSLILLKYDNSGNRMWAKKKRPQANGSSAEGIRVKVKNMNEIFVGGNFTSNNNQDIGFLRYDRFGNQNLEKFHNGSQNGKDKFLDIALGDSDYVYISGRVYDTGNLDSNIVLTYQYKDFNPTAQGDSMMKYTSDELIVGFHPKTIKLSKINNKEITYGRLGDFVQDSTCNKINAKFGASTYCQDWTVRKIFPQTQADSISIGRLGDSIRIPKFYANLLLNIPSGYSLTATRDTIRKVKPDVYYSDHNLLIQLTSANDPLYSSQHSVHSTTLYPNAHINADSAWAITSGDPSIKVGVYDSGVDFTHEDFAGINSGGLDYMSGNIQGLPLTNTDNDNHGISVAGIIGARRNNSKGIAGIAAGDVDSAKIGVSVYDMRIYNNGYLIGMQGLANAMYKGSTGTNIGGFGLHVMNNSYYISVNDKDTMTYPLIQDQLVYANQNSVAWVGTKQNWYLTNTKWATYPADWNPEISSGVGMSGNNGNNCSVPSNSANCGATNLFGYNLDFVAPGTASTVISPTVQQFQQPNGYAFRSGTSFAAPHVSSLMGLMMSYWNKPAPNDWNNLVHEDCENIIKRNCTDLANATYSESPNFDSVSGAGRINAYKTLKSMNKNYYRIRHIDKNHAITYSTTVVQISSAAPKYWKGFIGLNPQYTPSYVPMPFNAGTYTSEIYEITTYITYSLNPSETILDSWPFYKGCRGWAPDTVTPRPGRPYWAKIMSANNTTAVMKTYMWKNLNNGYYYPADWQYLHGSITLFTYDSTGTVGEHELAKQNLQQDFQVYPNPSFSEFKLSFYTEHYNLLNYQIFDILGREIRRETIKPFFGKNIIDISFKGAYGVYILKVYDRGKLVYTQKLIKNE